MEIISRAWLLLASSLLIQVASEASPGLLKVPKVYNALVTSDQNLEPSRAYPVIQPVVHRTAIGYVPPFYYAPLGPGLVGPVPLPGETSSQSPVTDNPDAERVESAKNVEDASDERSNSRDDENQRRDGKERVPLNFYPNDRSLFYNPYFYGYQAFPPLVPGPYYYDYQPGGPLLPIGLPSPALIGPARESAQRKVEQPRAKTKEIADVPPPEPTKRVEKAS